MSTPEVCPCCGMRVPKLNPHRMEAKKCELLLEVARWHTKGHPWVKAQDDPSLIRQGEATVQTDCVHVYRLTWFGLLESKAPRSGLYRVTDAGWMFIRGVSTVPATIWTRKGEVVRRSNERVGIDQVKGVKLDKAYWDSYWMKQQEHNDE